MAQHWSSFTPGETIVVREQWRDRLWSAVPHRVVATDEDTVISWVPTGTVSVWSSNRRLPVAAGLTREQRKLLALRTLEVEQVEAAEAPDKLFFHQRDRWSRVNLGWDPTTGAFRGWYVNFERPPALTSTGVTSMDLVIDIWVDPDRTWRWKDAEDFDRAISEGVHPPELRPVIAAEADLVVRAIDQGSGPFADHWTRFRPDPRWALPVLPESCARGGPEWAATSARPPD